MGCDIHCFVEKKSAEGTWELITGFQSDMYDENSEYFGSEKFKSLSNSPIDNRYYLMFAVLADVRNGLGFAGVKTHNPLTPISKPRGVPTDASIGYQAEVESWDCDGHSHSWLTVKELMDYDWDQLVVYQGLVGHSSYQVFKETGLPSVWCGGSNARKVSNEEMDEICKNPPDDLNDFSIQTFISWTRSLRDTLDTLIYKSIPQLVARCEGSDYESVRIVFFFDN